MKADELKRIADSWLKGTQEENFGYPFDHPDALAELAALCRAALAWAEVEEVLAALDVDDDEESIDGRIVFALQSAYRRITAQHTASKEADRGA